MAMPLISEALPAIPITEAEAEAAKRGIWRGTFERPSDWRQANPREVD